MGLRYLCQRRPLPPPPQIQTGIDHFSEWPGTVCSFTMSSTKTVKLKCHFRLVLPDSDNSYTSGHANTDHLVPLSFPKKKHRLDMKVSIFGKCFYVHFGVVNIQKKD